jgi:hypothetical protein
MKGKAAGHPEHYNKDITPTSLKSAPLLKRTANNSSCYSIN